MPRNSKKGNNNRRVNTPQSLNAYVKSICDIMRRGGAAGALQYVPELTWMLFLRILDNAMTTWRTCVAKGLGEDST